MATQGEYLVRSSVNDSVELLRQLETCKALALRISQRMVAIGAGSLVGYPWAQGYTEADFVALYTALNTLPGLVVADGTRDKLFKLVSSIQ